ncbi:MAG: DUF6519 domain-containing protein [Deltaproteobacteria bacterium]
MKVDISRETFRPQRHYSSVRLEQGRVQVDADWNEQIAINHHHTRTTARDVIGWSGAPKLEPGFQIIAAPDSSDLLIAPGKFYVDGLLCELDTAHAALGGYGPGAKQATVPLWIARALAVGNWVEVANATAPAIYTKLVAIDTASGVLTFDAEINMLGAGATLRALATYKTQPDLGAPVTVPGGTALLYLDVWERVITVLDDQDIREVALGGADTSTRTRIVWQVRALPLDAATTCTTQIPAFDALRAAPTGRLTARAKRDVVSDNPCLVPTSSGFRRLENQLYRVEIHDAGSSGDGTATFKWSRENGSVVGKITGNLLNVITLAAAPRDEVLGFSAGQWVEVTDDTNDLDGTPGKMYRLTKAEGKQLTLDAVSVVIDPSRNPKVRRWESAGAIAVAKGPAADDTYLRLEDGVQIRFDDGTYRTGDYWLIPARTITGDVEWPTDAAGPIAQPRKGPHHHYARLAIATTTAFVDDVVTTTIADCRKLFPPLTDITADDVSVHCDCDLLAKSKTVQEALDLLCHERDLRFHNQHLHGWGIVSGLQVQCGPDTVTENGMIHDVVTVKNGYAIDSRGNDIIVETKDAQGLETGDPLHVLDLLRKQGLLVDPADPNKLIDGSASLLIQQGSTADDRYRLELYDPNSNSWGSVFKDGFLWDVWMDALVPLVLAFKDEFVGPDEQTWEHIVAFINVLAQLLFKQNGPHVYISPKEDKILREFYDKLRKLLQSKTFCAMFDGRSFPSYDKIFQPATLDPRPSTIVGKVLQSGTLPTRMRLTPDGRTAYMVSGKVVAQNQSSLISIFDVANTEKQIASTAFPTSGATVTDVAFSPDSKTMYAIAILNGTDSLFCAATITDPTKITWGQVTTLCEFPLVTMQRSPLDAKKLYAVGRGVGLFQIDAGGLAPNQTELVAFNATGHLEIAAVGFGNASKAYAFCTVGATPTYDRVRRIDLANTAAAVFEFVLPATNPTGNDDICVAVDPDGKFSKLLVIAKAGTNQRSKQLVRFDAGSTGNVAPAAEATVDLKYTPPNTAPNTVDSTIYRLAYNPVTQRVMIASFDAFLIKMIPPTANVLDEQLHPTQLWPIAITFNPSAVFVSTDGQKRLVGGVFVLNALSGTINNIPAAYVGQNPQVVNLGALAEYHSAVLEAFVDLFGKFAQYLKDAFCEHFLVENPSNALKKLYLARIDIKDQQVFNICNFSRRRYVHSFPTVEYWMSIVPVLPVVRKLVGDWCCQIVQNWFSTVHAPDAATQKDVVSSSSAYNGLQFVQGLNVASVVSSTATSKLGLATALAKAFASQSTAEPPAPPPAPKSKAQLGDVTLQPAANATRYLADRKITVVGKEVASSANTAGTLVAPTALAPNDSVVLVTDRNDIALGYRVVKPQLTADGGPTNEAVTAELAKRDAAIEDLRGQLELMKKSNDAALTARDQQLEELKKSVSVLSARAKPAPR